MQLLGVLNTEMLATKSLNATWGFQRLAQHIKLHVLQTVPELILLYGEEHYPAWECHCHQEVLLPWGSCACSPTMFQEVAHVK